MDNKNPKTTLSNSKVYKNKSFPLVRNFSTVTRITGYWLLYPSNTTQLSHLRARELFLELGDLLQILLQ